MARNGSGTYNLPAGNPVTTGTTISSTWANSTLSDMATALTGSVAADGQTTPSANLPMGGFAHTNVGNATVRNMYPSSGQVQDGVITNLTSVAGTNTITAVGAVGMTAYATGQKFTFVSAGANTGAATLNINSIGAKAITKNGTTALVSGDMPLNAAIEVFYDGTQFQLLNPASVAANVSSFSAGTTGLTPSTATSGAVTLAGTLAVANGGTGLATLTANNVILGNGTSTPSFVAPSTSGNVLTSNGTTWNSTAIPSQLIRATSVATNTGATSYEFTGIPSGVKRITVMINGVARSGTTVTIIQIGSTTYTTTGYLGSSWPATGTAVGNSIGFGLAGNVSPGDPIYGIMTITNISGNIWVAGMSGAVSTANLAIGGGNVTIGGTLDRLRINSLSGTATFSAGSINIMYE